MIAGIERQVPQFRRSLLCVFSQNQTRFIFERGRMRITKDLRKLAEHCGRPLSRCLIVDDNQDTYRLNPSNALPIPPYHGAKVDDALARLQHFLLQMNQPGMPLDVRAYQFAPANAMPLLAEVQPRAERRTSANETSCQSVPSGNVYDEIDLT